MIRITINTSRNYDVIMNKGALAQAGTYIKEALQMDGSSKHPNVPANGTKLCIVTDATVDQLYGQEDQTLWASLSAAGFRIYKYTFPGGEKNKNMSIIESLLNYLADNQFTRSDVLLALGGGITGDITGFAAATFLRGIAFIQVPTSLLAIVDSSVGGKTGVNLHAGKNLAGAFWQPSLVLFDPDVLSTLSHKLKRDGVAEAIKAGCIADKHILDIIQNYENCKGGGSEEKAQEARTAQENDTTPENGITQKNGMMQKNDAVQENGIVQKNGITQENDVTQKNRAIEKNDIVPENGIMRENDIARKNGMTQENSTAEIAMLDDDDFLTRLAARAVEVKRQIVEADERENDLRQLLNFGHTIAHAIEKCSDYQISHGHAVATGMAMISAAAEHFGFTTENCHETILEILRRFQFPLDCPYTAERLTEAALQDKKRRGETITLIIPKRLGHCTMKPIPASKLRQFIAHGMDASRTPKGTVK